MGPGFIFSWGSKMAEYPEVKPLTKVRRIGADDVNVWNACHLLSLHSCIRGKWEFTLSYNNLYIKLMCVNYNTPPKQLDQFYEILYAYSENRLLSIFHASKFFFKQTCSQFNRFWFLFRRHETENGIKREIRWLQRQHAKVCLKYIYLILL